jgi:pyrophosphate--fructose-6-phosphate 1-phosphotransferase
VDADKTQVQKSGYFARSAPPNADDLALIAEMVRCAAESALSGVSGVIGHDEEQGNELRAIEFPRIKGGKAFDPGTPWFRELLDDIGQAGA